MTVYTTREALEAHVADLTAERDALRRTPWPKEPIAIRERMDRSREVERTLSTVGRLTAPVSPTDLASRQCDAQVPDARSSAARRSLRAWGDEGANWKRCGRTASHRFVGWLSGQRREECGSHASEYTAPVCWPLWIQGYVRVAAARKCAKRGHDFENLTYDAPLYADDWLNRGDTYTITTSRCKACGEWQEGTS